MIHVVAGDVNTELAKSMRLCQRDRLDERENVQPCLAFVSRAGCLREAACRYVGCAEMGSFRLDRENGKIYKQLAAQHVLCLSEGT